MARFEDMESEQASIKGFERAMKHAADMSGDGRISPSEFKEFTRFVIGEMLTAMPMDQHVKARENGDVDFMLGASGFDDGVDPVEGKRNRQEIAKKVVADYIGQLWNNGQIDDDGYIGHVENLGFRNGDGEDNPSKRAMMLYQGASGMPEAPPQADTESMEVPEEDIAAFRKRQSRT